LQELKSAVQIKTEDQGTIESFSSVARERLKRRQREEKASSENKNDFNERLVLSRLDIVFRLWQPAGAANDYVYRAPAPGPIEIIKLWRIKWQKRLGQ
jgi:hypothetical protein